MIGQTVSHYRVISALGRGGMGVVYVAKDLKLGRRVALKFLPPEFSRDAEAVERFQREARTASALNHPHICTIYEIDEHDGQHFIVMELLEGQTLHERLESGPVPLDQALEWGIEIADALHAAHSEGIIHRDIKPPNIFITRRGQAKVLDFGLAKIAPPSGLAGVDGEGATLTLDAVAKTPATHPGMIVGTVSYMSPEQARGLPVDSRTDIWSLGVTLYEIVAGHRPFTAPTGSDVMSLILMKDPPALTISPEEASGPFGEILAKALAKDREQRFQSVKDLGIDLKRLKQKLTVSTESARTGLPALGSSPAVASLDSARERSGPAPGVAPAASAVQVADTTTGVGVARAHFSPRRLGLLALLVALIAAGLAGVYLFYFQAGDSLAVMPFTYENSEPGAANDPDREYLSDGITESVINGVSQVPNLKVIARSSVFRYKGKEIDPPAVGRQLGVRKILTGRIVQRGDDLRISVELLDARENAHVWGEQYNRKLADLNAVSAEIASEISRSLRLRWRGAPASPKSSAETSETYQAYLKGRFYWNKRTGDDIRKSVQYYQQALAKDPKDALAYAGLADSYGILWVYSNVPRKEAFLRAKEAALNALEIDATLAEPHAVLASIKSGDEWDFPGADSEFRKAIQLNPNYATAHQWFAEHLMATGRFDEALEEITRAQELDPLSLVISAVVGEVHLRARHYDEAIAQLRKTIELDKNFPLAHSELRDAFEEKGLFEEAAGEDETAAALFGAPAEKAAQRAKSLRDAFAKLGPAGYWQKRLDFLQERSPQGTPLPYDEENASPYQIAGLYARLGKKDPAIRWLQKAFDERDFNILYLATAPQFDALRKDPAVAEMIGRLGLAH